jgi:hypothetical protein
MMRSESQGPGIQVGPTMPLMRHDDKGPEGGVDVINDTISYFKIVLSNELPDVIHVRECLWWRT